MKFNDINENLKDFEIMRKYSHRHILLLIIVVIILYLKKRKRIN